MVKLLQTLLKAYYAILTPLLGNNCRFVPSCSEYAHQALEKHGAFRGLWLTSKRVCRCHPWGGSGFDPVPEHGCRHVDKNSSAQDQDDATT